MPRFPLERWVYGASVTTEPTYIPHEKVHTIDGEVDLMGFDRAGLERWFVEQGEKRFRGHQVFKWIWQRGVVTPEEMTNLNKNTRTWLSERATIPRLSNAGVQASKDGTRKYLWECHDGSTIESVFIPDEEHPSKPRRTLCISTQVGCAMACSFCLTGDMGLKRNLTPSEIAGQVLQVAQDLGPDRPITNVVMMGMGEPLHNLDHIIIALRTMLDEDGLNLSHRKVTVSTVGLVPAMKKLASALPVNIAVSLNASTHEQRVQVMPITKKYSMDELMQTCRDLPLPRTKRITFEYVMMAGFNDSLEDAARLIQLMRGVKSKLNLIPYNENPHRDIKRPSAAQVKSFQHYLVSRGVHCSVRATRGRDISAACGQLGKGKELQAPSIEG
jgi:23S rRNA (adenine2503-C2)-methyltransferase